ncbi:hypothetical protein FI667_g8762, partial [Globisporangium splendens]
MAPSEPKSSARAPNQSKSRGGGWRFAPDRFSGAVQRETQYSLTCLNELLARELFKFVFTELFCVRAFERNPFLSKCFAFANAVNECNNLNTEKRANAWQSAGFMAQERVAATAASVQRQVVEQIDALEKTHPGPGSQQPCASKRTGFAAPLLALIRENNLWDTIVSNFGVSTHYHKLHFS